MQRRAVARHDAVLDHQREPLRAQPDAEAHVLDEPERLDQVAVAVREVGEARVSYGEGSEKLQRRYRPPAEGSEARLSYGEGCEKVQRRFRPLAEGREARVAESDAVAQRVAPRADDPAVVGGHHRNVGDAVVAQGLGRLDQPREVEVGARWSEGTYVRSDRR